MTQDPDLEVVLARAQQLWAEPAARDWLVGFNNFLDGARPIDVLRRRGPQEVLDALEAEAQGTLG